MAKNFDFIAANCLEPSPISGDDYINLMEEIKTRSKQEISVSEIFDDYSDKPYYFKTSGKLLAKAHSLPSIKDAASLYVLLDYLLTDDKINFDRNKSYKSFIDGGNETINSILYSISQGEPVKLHGDKQVDFIKGSLYKIKKYFLENNKIKDIRGASAILDYLNTEATLDYLKDKYIRECAIYCGGGNVLIISPKGEGEEICKDLERLYTETALTAKNAFEHITCTLNDIAVNYNEVLSELNTKLEERKKVKLYAINPDSDKTEIQIKGKKFNFKGQEIAEKGQVCKLCEIRDSKYKVPSPEGDIDVCPSCLRKNTVGRDKANFYDEFEKSQNVKMKRRYEINSINDIGDSRGYVALIYADGNNLGNVVKNIKTPFQHMYFSRKLEYTTKNCVYSAIYETMGEDAAFEAICLGGDDLLIVVPADRSLKIANKIIDKFDKAFNYNITISAGICIAKSTTPIQNMFSISQHCLKNAKKYERKSNQKGGTLDVVVIEGNLNIDLESRDTTLFPMTNKRAEKLINIIDAMREDKKVNKNQIYKFRYAAENMSANEFQLFYLYQVAKQNSRKYTEYINQIFDIENSSFAGLVQINDKLVSPWNDIALLWDYSGGESSEASNL